ncbi:MAG: hypothetical protein V3V74_07215 [Nitrosomonadaceae bacterium]
MKKTFLTLGLMALSALPLMAGTSTSITTIDEDSSDSSRSAIVRYEGHTAVAYLDDGELKLWIDDGAGEDGVANDGKKNGDEVVVIDDATDVDQYIDEHIDMIVHDGKLTIAYYYYDDGDSAFKLWHDDGYTYLPGPAVSEDKAGNGVADVDEIRTVYEESTRYFKMLSYEGNLAVAFYEDGEGDMLRLWIDDGESVPPGATPGEGTAGNFEIDGLELRQIDSGLSFGKAPSLFVNNDQLVVSYYVSDEGGEILYWCDDSTDVEAASGQVDEDEIRSFDGPYQAGIRQSAISYMDNIALFYTDAENEELSLWLDDGTGEGTAGDNEVDEDEIRVIHYVGSRWSDVSATLIDGKLACVFYDRSDANNDGDQDRDLSIWIDNNANGEYDAGEITKIDEGVIVEETEEVDGSEGDVGNNPDVFVEGGSVYISYDDRDADNIKLARITQDDDAAPLARSKSGGACIVTSQAGLMSALAALALMVLAFGCMKNKVAVCKK